MKETVRGLGLAAFLLGAAAAPAGAEIREWSTHVGFFNVTKSPTLVEAGLEVRFPAPWRDTDFTVGVGGTGESSFWAYAGGRYTFHLDERWGFSLGLALSVYEEGDGKDLGGPIEFRSHYELSYATGRRSRVSLLFTHLSNAGLYDQNPGTNSLVLAWSVQTAAPRPRRD